MSTSHTFGGLLLQSEGFAHAAAPEVILKACLEADTPVGLFAGPAGTWFERIARLAAQDAVRAVLRRHDLRISVVDDGPRALFLAQQHARSGRPAVAAIPRRHIARTCAWIAAQDGLPLISGLVLMIEYAPEFGDVPSAVELLRRLNLPVVAPGDLPTLRGAVDQAFHLSRAAETPAAILMHHQVLREIDTLPCMPNRVVDTVEVSALIERRRRRRFRATLGEGALRAARRMELNRLVNLPSPGEQVELGFIAVGPAIQVLKHLLLELDLVGRIPILELRMISPVDEASLERLMTRCRRVVLLDPSPGDVEPEVLRAVNVLRRRNHQIGQLWTRLLPPGSGNGAQNRPGGTGRAAVGDVEPQETLDAEGNAGTSKSRSVEIRRIQKSEGPARGAASIPLMPGDVLSPSRLAARLLHLLPRADKRTGGAVEPVDLGWLEPALGWVHSAEHALHEHLIEVGRALASPRSDDDELQPAQPLHLVIEGSTGTWEKELRDPHPGPRSLDPSIPSSGASVIRCEIWDEPSFVSFGRSAVHHAAVDADRRMIIVMAADSIQGGALARLAEAMTPPESAGRIRVSVHDLADSTGLRAALRECAQSDGSSVVVVNMAAPRWGGDPAAWSAAWSHEDFLEGGDGAGSGPGQDPAEGGEDLVATDREGWFVGVDRDGFSRHGRVIQSADEPCNVRPSDVIDSARFQRVERQTAGGPSYSIDRLSGRLRGRIRVRVRPLFEVLDVVRVHPPVTSLLSNRRSADAGRVRSRVLEDSPWLTPRVLHGSQPVWRAHLAPVRGEDPGLAAMILIEAGRRQGYCVRGISSPVCSATSSLSSRWTQVVFTRMQAPSSTSDSKATPGSTPGSSVASTPRGTAASRDGSMATLASAVNHQHHPRVPFGEADLLIGGSARALMEACINDPDLRVADPDRTVCVGDLVEITRLPDEMRGDGRRRLLDALSRCCRSGHRDIRDFSGATRVMFGTSRPVDIVMLGAAYQSGFIPLKPESIDAGLGQIESLGFSRVREAFEFGRLLVCEQAFAVNADRPPLHGDAASRRIADRRASAAFRLAGVEQGAVEPVARTVRRSVLLLRRESRRLRHRAADFRRVIEAAISAMPGLSESEAGRLSLRDFIAAMDRCVRWGGLGAARRYSELITALYEADRGDRGRSLTRHAILPLSSALLIRDAPFVATMAMSLEARRLARERLNFRASRRDEMSRRFLNRFEIVAFGYRLRIDFRSSDWTAAVVARLGAVVPNRLRGGLTDRRRRDYIVDLVERATRAAPYEYDRWDGILRELHDLTLRGQLRHFSERALRFLIEPEHTLLHRAPDDDADLGPEDVSGENDETGVRIAQG